MKYSLLFSLFILMYSTCFGQNQGHKTTAIEGVRAISSQAFNKHYLRMDARGLSKKSEGGGVVNVANRLGEYEWFNIARLADGTYSIESVAFKGRYLGMNGQSVSLSCPKPGGFVYTQNRVGHYERFNIKKVADGSYSIESVAFPGRYLTLNPNPKPASWDNGGGKVQMNTKIGDYERFHFLKKGWRCGTDTVPTKITEIEGVRAISSQAFKEYYLSMDAQGLSKESEEGGVVKVAHKIGKKEWFNITRLADGTYSIESVRFKGRYLRMDGQTGLINTQNRVGHYERFNIKKVADGSYSIESVAFPGRYLGLNKREKIYMYNKVGSHERFHFLEEEWVVGTGATRIEGIKAISSQAFKEYYLSIDAQGLSKESEEGGVVKVAHKIGKKEWFNIARLADGTYSIESVRFKGRYLRMDGRIGTGTISTQNRVGHYERFKIKKVFDGSYSIESVAFPGKYLGLNKREKIYMHPKVGAHERFHFLEKNR